MAELTPQTWRPSCWPSASEQQRPRSAMHCSDSIADTPMTVTLGPAPAV